LPVTPVKGEVKETISTTSSMPREKNRFELMRTGHVHRESSDSQLIDDLPLHLMQSPGGEATEFF
jgi:hypothetical protein